MGPGGGGYDPEQPARAGWDAKKGAVTVQKTLYITVLRCFVWVVTASCSRVDVEFADEQIDHGREVSD
jgi:hypothetical protein